MEQRRFDGKTILITGASSGLGAALARVFSYEGAMPALVSRSVERLEEVAECCRRRGASPLVIPGDVTSADDVQAAVDETVRRFGRLDLAVACAGLGFWTRFSDLEDPSALERVMRVNYHGATHLAYYALPHLMRWKGSFVAVSSIQGRIGAPYHSGYSASKHALDGFCKALRMELRGTGVNLTTVYPHWFQGTRFREQALGADGKPRGTESRAHRPNAMRVDRLAGIIAGAVHRRKRNVFVPRWLRWLAWLSETAPALAEWLISRRVEREASGPPAR